MATTARLAALLGVICCTRSSILPAQSAEAARARALYGCWKTDVGAFKAITKVGIDSGLTNVPPMVRLDTLPGRSFTNQLHGRLLTAMPGASGSRYREGYYELSGTNVVAMNWTNGFVGLGISLKQTSDSMRGTAQAWTDYLGAMEAPITLRRTACP